MAQDMDIAVSYMSELSMRCIADLTPRTSQAQTIVQVLPALLVPVTGASELKSRASNVGLAG
jgi:hypothetical protein